MAAEEAETEQLQLKVAKDQLKSKSKKNYLKKVKVAKSSLKAKSNKRIFKS